MIVYVADKAQFLSDNDDRDIADVVLRKFRQITGHRVGEAELRAWENSLGRMANVLRDEGIPHDTGVAIEFHIPQSSKRIDVTLTGRGADGAKNMVIVELKQWEEAQATAKDAIVLTFVGRAIREEVHPSYQAWSYATLLEGFHTAVYEGGIALWPCAYLHNYYRDGVIDSPHYAGYMAKAPLFLRGESEVRGLRDFIKRHVQVGDSAAMLDELEKGKVRPSKALADSLSKLMKGNPEFVLIDEQKAVYEAALAAGQAASTEEPRVVLIEGGPGTGKTVLAINLLVGSRGPEVVVTFNYDCKAEISFYNPPMIDLLLNILLGSFGDRLVGDELQKMVNKFHFTLVDLSHLEYQGGKKGYAWILDQDFRKGSVLLALQEGKKERKVKESKK